MLVELGPGAASTLEFALDGEISAPGGESGRYLLELPVQSAVQPLAVEVRVDTGRGWSIEGEPSAWRQSSLTAEDLRFELDLSPARG